jgi:spore coat protein CotH
MRPRSHTRVAFLVASLLMGGAASAPAQTADQLFDDRALHDFRLYIHERDLDALRVHYDASMFFPVDVVWNGVRANTAGVRVRGLASRTAVKPGLLLDFDRYVRGQTFVGVTELALDNLVTDPSALHESVSMAMFRRLGQPAPREAYARLYINDAYQGVYALVESVTPPFLARSGYDADGYLFEKVYAGPFRGEDRGSLAVYGRLFEARTRQFESDSILYGPIQELFEEANHSMRPAWRSEVARYIDLEQFVTYVATEMCLAEDDGVLGFAGMANFYLHRSGGGAHRLIPWDKDSTFTRVDVPILHRAGENVLVSRALAFDDLRARYLDALEACARAASEGAWLEGEITRLATLVSPALRGDLLKPYSDEQHDAAVASLIDFARRRPAFVVEQVRAARAGR